MSQIFLINLLTSPTPTSPYYGYSHIFLPRTIKCSKPLFIVSYCSQYSCPCTLLINTLTHKYKYIHIYKHSSMHIDYIINAYKNRSTISLSFHFLSPIISHKNPFTFIDMLKIIYDAYIILLSVAVSSNLFHSLQMRGICCGCG